MALIQHTGPIVGDNHLNADLTVTTDGLPNTDAIVTQHNGIYRIDLTGSGTIDVNPIPHLGLIRITRELGFQNALGYRCVLEAWDASATPNAIALAVYSSPGAVGYQYTTGAMLWDSGNSEWYCTCPAGFEPGQVDINFAILYGATPICSFTMLAEMDGQSFGAGGDWS